MPTSKSAPPPTTTPLAFESDEGRVRPRVALAAATLFVAACGGGSPLFHGAHVLNPGATAEGAGFSGTFTTGDAKAAARSPRAAERSAALDALAPRVAPWVNARVGIGAESEAGLTYSGRAVRLDARRAFEDGAVALSVGAGASAVLRGGDSQRETTGTSSTWGPWGYGFDVPVVVGWKSSAGVVSLWGGVRGGFEKLTADRSSAIELDLNRWYGGGLVGLGLGFRHVQAALELDAYYQGVSGSFAGDDVRLHGVTLTPGAGLIFTF